MSHQASIGRFALCPTLGMAIAGVAVLVSLASLSCKRIAAPGAIPPTPTVTVASVVQKDVPVYEESVGTTVGFVNANILPKVSGYLLKQDYQEPGSGPGSIQAKPAGSRPLYRAVQSGGDSQAEVR
jgi:hypothetical protein